MKTISRNKFFSATGSLFFGGLALPAFADSIEDPALSAHEMIVMEEMAKGSDGFLWEVLKGVTDHELDWKPNPESNSIRWIVGHLCWFEEWFSDTIGERKGRYLSDKKPMSITDESFENVKVRYERARAHSSSLATKLTPTQLETIITFVGRFEIPLRMVPRIHVSHLSGHLYQIRYIRGTYSRVFKTNKALFDPW